MNFQSFGQTVKGHSRDLDGKSKGKTEQARKVRAKPVGRNQLGVKMQLSLDGMERGGQEGERGGAPYGGPLGPSVPSVSPLPS